MTIKKRLPAAGLALLLVLLLFAGPMACAYAEEPGGKTERFNVVLVVDKSGSLVCGEGGGTDPDGLRFEALRMFLGLLTESGNNVGAIVFDEVIRYDSGLKPMNGMADKAALIGKVEEYYASYDTDVGTAVLRAVEELYPDHVRTNTLPCMILLFSDGMTDFTSGDVLGRFQKSWDRAQWALEAAQELGIVINGVLLNVDGQADERGIEEFRLYTYGTDGEFEEVKRAEDLGKAFLRLYHIVNRTEYKGAQRVALSDQGEAELSFTVPSFGVEEVNIVVEGENLRDRDKRHSDTERVRMDIFSPAGERFDTDGHVMESARYLLVKIPNPGLGVWNVRLHGEPGDWVDITKVYNSFLGVTLEGVGDVDAYKINTPCEFSASVMEQTYDEENPITWEPTQEELRELNAVLTVEDLTTGAVREYAMDLTDGGYSCTVSFPRSGDFGLSASVGLGDFAVCSEELVVTVENQPIIPTVSVVADMLNVGHFSDDCWEVELYELFGVGKGSSLTYTLSDDLDGELTVSDGVLQARFRGRDAVSFTVTAEDETGQRAEIPFSFTVPAVEAGTSRVNGFWSGHFRSDCWELELDKLFNEPKPCALRYTLSDDCGGALELEDGTLRVYFRDGKPLTFSVTARDIFDHEAVLPFELTTPVVTTSVQRVTDMLKDGTLKENTWSTELDRFFTDPKDCELLYSLSDDYDGALRIEDGVLTMDVGKLKSASFTVTATDIFGLETELPFQLTLPGPTAAVSGISETIRTGIFQEGTWEQSVSSLFRDPKGTKLTYTLSDDFGGAVKLSSGTLHADCGGLKKAAFTLRATDEYGLSTEIPITLTERNMTLVYALYVLGGLSGIGLLAALILFLRNRYF